MTTYSTVACTKYLLREERFFFVLTRRFNSDPIESLFGTLRMSSGCNDTLDVRAALSGLEKVLKTGIATANAASNVAHSEVVVMSGSLPANASASSSEAAHTNPSEVVLMSGTLAANAAPSTSEPACTSHAQPTSTSHTLAQTPSQLKRAAIVLQRLTASMLPQYLPSLQISATVYVGGYIARVVSEKMNCENCLAVCTKPVNNQPLLQFSRCQDRGGLLYPSDQLLFALDTLRAFADSALKNNPTLQKPLSELTKCTVPALCSSRLLKCRSDDSHEHRVKLMDLISVRFLRPLLSNYAFTVTDKHDARKYFAKKPLSRKYARL